MTLGRDGKESPTCFRDCRFHSAVLKSVDETATNFPLGEKDIAAMLAVAAWSGDAAAVPRRAFQKRTWPFSVPTASRCESGENAIADAWLDSRRRNSCRPDWASQPTTVESELQHPSAATVLPSGLKYSPPVP